jgi:hypothetical protein
MRDSLIFFGVPIGVLVGLAVWAGFGIQSYDEARNKCWDHGGYSRSTGWGGFGTECVVNGHVVQL